MIAPNIIIVWTGTNASIPSGYVRETTLDGYYPKGAGAENPNVTGGSATHTHTSASHTHTMASHSHTVTLNDKGSNNNNTDGSGSESFGYDHGHTASVAGVSGGGLQGTAVTYGSMSNDPPYKTVIFIKSSGYSFCPPSACMLWKTATAPSGFGFCDGSGGRPNYLNVYIKGANSGADAGTTGGSTANIHNIDHTHTESSHSHAATITGGTCSLGGARAQSGGSNEYIYQQHDHNISLNSQTSGVDVQTINLTTAETVEPYYKKVGLIQNTSGVPMLKTGSIAMYLGSTSSIPAGWKLCDGTGETTDLRDFFVKVSDTAGNITTTGGSNTHTHASQLHSHTGGSHTHGNADSSDWIHTATDRNQRGVGGNLSLNLGESSHDAITVANSTTSWDSSSTAANSSSNQPQYRTVSFIEYKTSSLGSALFFQALL